MKVGEMIIYECDVIKMNPLVHDEEQEFMIYL